METKFYMFHLLYIFGPTIKVLTFNAVGKCIRYRSR